jgi:hypothetical protein
VLVVPWLAWFADALSPKVARAGQFSLATGGDAHVCLAQTASSSSPVSTTSNRKQDPLGTVVSVVSLLSHHSLAPSQVVHEHQAQAPGHLHRYQHTSLLLLPDLTTVNHHHHHFAITTTITFLFPLPSLCLSNRNRNRHLTIALLIAPVAPSSAVFQPALPHSLPDPATTTLDRREAHCDLPLHLTPAYPPIDLPNSDNNSHLRHNTLDRPSIGQPSAYTPAHFRHCHLRRRHPDSSSTASPTHHHITPPPPIHVYNTTRRTIPQSQTLCC